MTILVKLFGNLINKVSDKGSEKCSPLDININSEEVEYITDILKKLKIAEDETSHIFVNGVYAGFRKKVKDGDRVGIFPKNMGLLYKWYFTKHEDD
ncbi:MAG: MoaD/ThiS family protein [Promethearchaeota archaeon]